jgi:putative ABC transport system substrate-binding protein
VKRRDFIKLLGGAGAAWPIAARAQQMPIIGFLHSGSASYLNRFLDSIHEGLAETGYVDGKNIVIESRLADGHYDRLASLALDLVNRQVAVILAMGGTDPAKAAKSATAKIPIVFVSAADPVKTGLVTSLNRPGGNVTGVSLIASALESKKLALMRELAPQASTIAALTNPNYPEMTTQVEETKEAASSLGVTVIALTASTEDEINAAFAAAVQRGARAMLVSSDPFFNSHSGRFVEQAALHSIPVIYPQSEYVHAGGLISYGPNYSDSYRSGGIYVGKILRGANPSELPIVQPTKFELVINLKTARTLGITLPSMLLALADEVIER